MIYTISHIVESVNGKLIQHFSDASIQHLLHDSRLLFSPADTLFIAIQTTHNDGHQYIESLYRQGVQNFLITDFPNYHHFPNANFIQVDNTLQALQQLATYHRNQFSLPIIGITGSNGKTTIKEWLHQLLQNDLSVVRSPQSYNSQLGVPLSIWQIQSTHTLGIFEAGISQPQEMQKLQPIIRPTIGIFTNIGDAHQVNFESLAQKVREKLCLFKSCEVLLYSIDDTLIHDLTTEQYPELKTFTWSRNSPDADLYVHNITSDGKNSIIEYAFEHHKYKCVLPFKEDASINNALHCLATMLYLSKKEIITLSFDDINQRLTVLSNIALRLELKEGIRNTTIINDAYNADLTSLIAALQFLKQQQTHQNSTLILSDFHQLKPRKSIYFQTISALLEEYQINRLIGIGEHIKHIQPYLSEAIQTVFFDDTEAFLSNFSMTNFCDENILVKGARTFKLERISQRLTKKVHKTVLEVNLNAIVHNLKTYRSFLKPKTKIMVMVKAEAYGCGAVKIAHTLVPQHVDYLTVAYIDEAIELREHGIKLPILVLNPEEIGFEAMIQHHIEPELYNFSILEEFIRTLKSSNLTTPYPIHIKIDTGMNRLGFEEKDIRRLIQLLLQHQSVIKIESIFSHLSAADESIHSDFTKSQIMLYQKIYKAISEAIGYQPIRHILNSAGIINYSDHQMDMVRLGIGLYGFDSSEHIQSRLESVMTLKASISQIKSLKKGETIGYGRNGQLDKDGTIATVSIGYADGWSRSLSNGKGKVWIHNQAAPIVGNVCMDMCMVDISHIPEAKEGDEVILFDRSARLIEIAKAMDTIPYELLTKLSNRVKRLYVKD